MTRAPDETDWIPPYEGEDMAAYLFEKGFQLVERAGAIRSVTNVRNTAIIVTDYGVWRAKPYPQIGFAIELLMML